MRVQFDLRPVSMLEKERKKSSFSIMRLLVTLLFIAFLGISSFYIGTIALKTISLNEEIEMKQEEVDNLQAVQTDLEAEINRLKAREALFADSLKIMQDELPTLEVLEALEINLLEGMYVNSIRFTPGTAAGAASKAVLEASAATEKQIVDLTTGLAGSGVFSGVVMPSSALDDKTGRVSFTLNLDILSIGQINPDR